MIIAKTGPSGLLTNAPVRTVTAPFAVITSNGRSSTVVELTGAWPITLREAPQSITHSLGDAVGDGPRDGLRCRAPAARTTTAVARLVSGEMRANNNCPSDLASKSSEAAVDDEAARRPEREADGPTVDTAACVVLASWSVVQPLSRTPWPNTDQPLY
ncbi:MAG: hypothetical protein GY769_04285 [bacterium]|nr:hypothetical protein [bacterium]